MTDAIKKFLIFTVAVAAFVGVRLVSEEWFFFPEALSMALGFFVMGVIIKPLVARDLPMSRWIVVPLTGMAIVSVLLTAPRWYERWTAADYTLPSFLPTEEDFVAQVIYYAMPFRAARANGEGEAVMSARSGHRPGQGWRRTSPLKPAVESDYASGESPAAEALNGRSKSESFSNL